MGMNIERESSRTVLGPLLNILYLYCKFSVRKPSSSESWVAELNLEGMNKFILGFHV